MDEPERDLDESERNDEYLPAKIPEPEPPMAEENPWIPIVGFFGMLLGGTIFAGWMGGAMAPEADFAVALSALAFPAAFMVGMLLWLGARFPALLLHILGNLLRWARKQPPAPGRIRPGSFIFIPISTVFCSLAGLAIGAASTEWSIAATATVYSLAGLGYGAWLWRMAETGHFPLPRDM